MEKYSLFYNEQELFSQKDEKILKLNDILKLEFIVN
jgi:hypothetical protein